MKFILIAFSISLFGCDKDKGTSLPIPPEQQNTTVVYKEIEGVDPNLLSLDIYYNNVTTNKKPVVMWVHGGAWSLGDKTNNIEQKVDLFHSLDYVFVSVNYRLSPFPNELNNPNRIMYPSHNEDLADAIRWVYDHIDRFGGNSDKIALLGHSAGAHLVSLTGLNKTFLEQVGLNLTNLKGIASIDTQGYDVLAKVQENNNFYINAFGTNTELNIQASPIYNIEQGSSYPRFFVAKRGSLNRIGVANDFIEALEQQGVSVTQIDGSIYDHAGINNAIGAPDETLITNALLQFFNYCFR